MKLLRSDFSKVHFVGMLFGLVNVGMAIVLRLGLLPYAVAIMVHQVSGFLLIPLLLLVPALFRKRRQLYTAFRARLFPSRRDFAQKNTPLILAKTVTLLMLLGFLSQVTTAALLRTGLGNRWFPGFDFYTLHTSFLYVLPALVVLHTILMIWATRRKLRA